jgi:sec-independent protein translocase protein TatB
VFGIQTSELVVIALIAILLFGPERVPEFFHRAGQLMSRLQRSADDLWTSLQTEMNQVTKPLEDLGEEIKSIGESIVQPGEATGNESDEADDDDPPPGDDDDPPPGDDGSA